METGWGKGGNKFLIEFLHEQRLFIDDDGPSDPEDKDSGGHEDYYYDHDNKDSVVLYFYSRYSTSKQKCDKKKENE
ncbi:hypothetical protein TNCT_292771 [Trichonephila clavata]|uniref:Uncharacterized protein n=1 Tax=Trichonephila clavata TaxID=2740835 RepID=A0A8X6KF49_TRICU|nr:hypothetical protein TNCT_292771 [Trichonephila clavata]